MAFEHHIPGVADLDQRWDALQNKGSYFCVPTSAMNWMYYYADHGRPGALGVPKFFPNHIPTNIAAMGKYMDTDPKSGTSAGDQIDGLEDWLDDHKLPAVVATRRARDNDAVTYASIRNQIKSGSHLIVGVGRYKKDGKEFDRTGGHAMTLVGLKRTDKPEVITAYVHDPADDGDRKTQSAPAVKDMRISEGKWNLEGDKVTALRWGTGTDPYQFLDGWTAIQRKFALTNSSESALAYYVADINTGKVETKEFPLPFGTGIDDLVIHALDFRASVVARGSGEVWTLDLVEGTWSKIAAAGPARFLAYGGRRPRLFVATGRTIEAFDEEGKPQGRLDAKAGIDAISYDQKQDRLVVASSAAKRLLAITPKLEILSHIEAPEVAGTGRLSLSVNGRDATVVLSRQGTQEAATVRWNGSGTAVAGRIRLAAQGVTGALHVSRKGRLFASDAGKITTFDADGKRLADSTFDGLKAGPLLKIARSASLLDDARSRRNEWKN